MSTASPTAPTVRLVAPSTIQIVEGANPRRTFDPDTDARLAATVALHGVLQPLLVRADPDDAARFLLIAGERRLRAARAAGLAEVPVLVRADGPGEDLHLALIENLQRAEMSPIEEAEAFRRALTGRLTQRRLADLLGVSASLVRESLALLAADWRVNHCAPLGRVRKSRCDPAGLARLARSGVPSLETKMAQISQFSYKGVDVSIDLDDDDPTDGHIRIEDKVFHCHQMEGPLPMWHCDESFYAPDTLDALARHFVDLWHIFGRDDRIPVDRILSNAGLDPAAGGHQTAQIAGSAAIGGPVAGGPAGHVHDEPAEKPNGKRAANRQRRGRDRSEG